MEGFKYRPLQSDPPGLVASKPGTRGDQGGDEGVTRAGTGG